MNMNQTSTHKTIQPPILYYGTPVVLLTTLNEDETTNISPISSSWALGDTIVLGLGVGGKGLENLQRHGECTLNIPDPSMWQGVEALAPLTGADPVPAYKQQIGFRYEKDKFQAANFSATPSVAVKPARIMECPIQIESRVQTIRIPDYSQIFAIVEVQAVQVHVHEELIVNEKHIDPAKWSPLIYNFRHYFGLGQPLGKTFRAEA
ncbi:flavin reductase family protein [Brevibacillus sp. SYSU BS000544]|uniref:flavin reductase family protein n=1 Tax=Brevibacillus sp. SYSU BS000544 TaxID=3416443 RepID=UPI003CE5BBF7